MHVYKELSFVGNKPELDKLSEEIYNVFPTDWIKPKSNQMLKDYILADYIGTKAPHAEVSIYYGKDTWREGYIKVCNIVPLQKSQLTIDEYNQLLELFYNDIAKVYGETHEEIKVVGPSSGQFDPLDYISEKALKKLGISGVEVMHSSLSDASANAADLFVVGGDLENFTHSFPKVVLLENIMSMPELEEKLKKAFDEAQ